MFKFDPAEFQALADKLNEEFGVLISRTLTPSDFPQVEISLANGRVVSVVRHQFSYGGSDGLYEALVMNDDTAEPEGWLTVDDVVAFVRQVLELPVPKVSTVPEHMVTFSI